MAKKNQPSQKEVANKSKLSNLLKQALLYLYLFILAVSFFSTYSETYDEKVFLGGDNAAYYLLGKSIADGKGYVNSHLVHASPANHFPPGYSFIIGQVLNVTNGDLQTIKHLNGFFFLGVIFLIFFIARRLSKNDHFAFVTALFILFNMHYLQYSSIVMSEMIFAFFSLLTILSFLLRKDNVKFYKSPWYYIGIASMILAIYIRTQGVVFLGVWILWGIVKKNWVPMALGVAVVFMALLPWQIRSANLGGSGYEKQLKRVNPYNASEGVLDFGALITRIENNAIRYLGKEIPNAITPRFFVNYKKDESGEVPGPTGMGYLVGSLYVLLCLFGAWRLKKWRWFLLFYLGGNLIIFMCWPDVWFGIRFMFPVIPLVSFLIFFGVFELFNWIVQKISAKQKELKPAYALVLLAFVGIHSNPYEQYKAKANMDYPLKWKNYMDASKWAKEGLPDSSVVACRKPHLFAIESDKTVSTFRYTEDLDTLLQGLINDKVTHVVVESIGFTATFKYLYPTVRKYKDKFKLVHKSDPEEAMRLKNPAAFKNKASTGAFIFEFNPNIGYFGGFDDNGLRTGPGKVIRPDGVVFEGNFESGRLNGEAMFTTPAGETYKGNYVKGKRNGVFINTKANQEQFEIIFRNDSIISQRKL